MPGAAQAKSYLLPQAVVQVKIAPDGSLLIREDITFSFAGSFSGAYRDIPLRDGESIDLVPVSEEGRAIGPAATPSSGVSIGPTGTASDGPGIACASSGTTGRNGGIRTFTVSYRFRGVAVAYDDVVDVNLQVWGSQWPVPCLDLRAQMELPRPIALQGTRYRVWGAPAWVNGVVDRARTGTSLRAANIPPASSSRCARCFPRRLLTSTRGARVVNGNGFAAHRRRAAETGETTTTRTAGRSTRRRQPRPDADDDGAFALLPALGVMLLIWFFFGRERGTGYDREYEQEPPSDELRRSCRRS